VLALLAAIAVEIAIDIRLQAGGPPLPACVAAAAIGWMVLRRSGAAKTLRSKKVPYRRGPVGQGPYEAGTTRALVLLHSACSRLFVFVVTATVILSQVAG